MLVPLSLFPSGPVLPGTYIRSWTLLIFPPLPPTVQSLLFHELIIPPWQSPPLQSTPPPGSLSLRGQVPPDSLFFPPLFICHCRCSTCFCLNCDVLVSFPLSVSLALFPKNPYNAFFPLRHCSPFPVAKWSRSPSRRRLSLLQQLKNSFPVIYSHFPSPFVDNTTSLCHDHDPP